MNHSSKIIFFGTPQFAVSVLEQLIKHGFIVSAVVTQPDKPVGRRKILSPSPIKTTAQKHNIPILQPDKIDNETMKQCSNANPDVFIVAAYGKILPQNLLDIPPKGNINIHPSLLPKYRGPSPLQTTILNGDKKTGVSVMLMDHKMDHGPLLAQYEHSLSGEETYETLGNTLFNIAAENLPEIIKKHIRGDIVPEEQDHSQATFCKLIKREDGLIDWTKSAETIERMTRAYTPWPGTFTKENLKIHEVNLTDKKSSESPGTLLSEDNTLYIVCGEKTTLEIKKLQPPGKKTMTGTNFILGYSHLIKSTYKEKKTWD